MKPKQPAVYIMANKRNGTLYTGVTSDLLKRVYEHRESLIPGFTSQYGCKILVWYEQHDEMASAILRENRSRRDRERRSWRSSKRSIQIGGTSTRI